MRWVVLAAGLLSAIACGDGRGLSRPKGASDAEWGKLLYFKLACATCHDIHGQRRTGPPLNGVFGSEVVLVDDSTVVFDREYFRQSVLEPNRQLVKGYPQPMPSYRGQVSDEQLTALEAYLQSLD